LNSPGCTYHPSGIDRKLPYRVEWKPTAGGTEFDSKTQIGHGTKVEATGEEEE
jgi:hypothetical protein